jgi:hypothetical protein
MGLSCVNFHARGVAEDEVRCALVLLGAIDFRVKSSENHWVSFVEVDASGQDVGPIQSLAAAVSRQLSVPVLAFLVHDSEVACYWLYTQGELRDEYNSYPGYFDEAVVTEGPSGGDAEVLAALCCPNADRQQLQETLRSKELFGEDIVIRLAELLGLSAFRALWDFASDDPIGEVDDEDDTDAGSEINTDELRRTLVEQARPQATTSNGLVEAVSRGDLAALEAQLGAGANVESLGVSPVLGGLTPFSIFHGPARHPPITPLQAAVLHCQRDAARRLLHAGAKPNQSNSTLASPMHIAAMWGNFEMLTLLLENGGDADATDVYGQTPMDLLDRFYGEWETTPTSTLLRRLQLNSGKTVSEPEALSIRQQFLDDWERCARALGWTDHK